MLLSCCQQAGDIVAGDRRSYRRRGGDGDSLTWVPLAYQACDSLPPQPPYVICARAVSGAERTVCQT